MPGLVDEDRSIRIEIELGIEHRESPAAWLPLPASCSTPVEKLAVEARLHILLRHLTSYDDIVDHCCEAWKKLVNRPWTITSIGVAHRSRSQVLLHLCAQGSERTHATTKLATHVTRILPVAYNTRSQEY